MGKKRIIKKRGGSDADKGLRARSISRTPKRKLDKGRLYIKATYNNTKLTFTDVSGNTVLWSSSGTLGFKGARKSTPFAAAKVGELVGEKAAIMGVKDVDVVINGVGSGRESSLRAFIGRGIHVSKIKDVTPIPFNGPRPKRPRRV
jgi:small subunit ribosomal protein S11